MTATPMVGAQVVESRPVIVGTGVRHFVRLRILDRGSAPSEFDRFAQVARTGRRSPGASAYESDARLAVVAREFQVRLVNCSRSGCLLEVDRALELGTVGTLSLTLEGHELTDHILVTRCQAIAGAGSLHHIGARLLWVEAPTVAHHPPRTHPGRKPGLTRKFGLRCRTS